MKTMQHLMAVVVATATVFVSATGPARSACVENNTTQVVDCSGAFLVAPYNAIKAAGTVNNAFSEWILNVNSLTQHILPDISNPGVGLFGYGSSGQNRGTAILFNGERGGDGVLAPEVTINYNGGAFIINTLGPTVGPWPNQVAHGIVGISRGGHGGNGGNSFDLAFGVGGDGGHAAAGRDVSIQALGFIRTQGDAAHGILAQSLGGNGGNGGDGNSSISGEGGRGGNAAGGGDVRLTSSADIETSGNKAHGILIQSAGGRGGAGGDARGIVGEGGVGGITAAGGRADGFNYGNITVNGTESYGILVQSIGGFGGAGGDGGGIVGYGSSGTSAGDGGGVGFRNEGSITTLQNDSHAIMVQSVGGGGGVGGSGAGIVGLGATGATGGAGGTVLVQNIRLSLDDTIQTSGHRSAGIFAQSIGGGGGDGGGAAGISSLGGNGSATSNSDYVRVTNSQHIMTAGDKSQAIFSQSIGGGGGNGGASLGLLTVGGAGGGGGDGGEVRTANSGNLTTTGDKAVGIFAQSVGGGGGDGGIALGVGSGFAMSIGGTGGSGGDSGTVRVNPFFTLSELKGFANTGTISTGDISGGGYKAHGIQAQSIGGGGGNGGFAFAGSVGEGFSAAVALGGDGGAGGNANTVLVQQNGTISTRGGSANGIFAQSVGGGGGDGGGTVAAALSGGKSVSFAMGGKGGTGGLANTVEVNHVGEIQTHGKHANGILAQSVGGGGGNGGFSVAAGLGLVAASFAFGGDGGAGSAGDDVTVRVLAYGDPLSVPIISDIVTRGDLANGIFAQSVGGGGGNGGFSGAGSLAASSSGSAIGLSMGGSGGVGAVAGNVDISNANNIDTIGTQASGILAQSVGGGGGHGGFSLTGGGGGGRAFSGAVGGSGGSGNSGGLVNVANDGDIGTLKDKSYGILAQSVGGGGGNGGFAFSGSSSMSLASTSGLSVSAAIGGNGGVASHGSSVTVDNHGSLATRGINSHAIFAQSVGGGGGNGGWAGSVAINATDGASVGIGVGGNGAGGGNGGAVTLNSGIGVSGETIVTTGKGASGLFAQSVGGGGGDGGFGFAGAFGYAGGMTRINAAVGVGGMGGVGGTGSSVDVDNQTAIMTGGEDASGLFAQSVGGGGGNGGFAVSGTLSWANPTPGARTFPVGLTVGGEGGIGNSAGNVSVTNSETITTSKKESKGIFAQSIGGGGGNGGLAVTTQLTGPSTNALTMGGAIGGGGGTGNFAGTVSVTNNLGGVISTDGKEAHGIQAQSIGEGGGNGGLAVTVQLGKAGGTVQEQSKTLNVGVSVGGAGGDGGYGNAVSVTNQDSINVGGESASGIFAQSVGGGGGNGGGSVTAVGLLTDSSNPSSRTLNSNFSIGGGGGNGNHGGNVNVSNAGVITTQKGSGYGIFAQSIGGGGGIGGRANSLKLAVAPACGLPVICSGAPSASNNYGLGATIGGDGGGASNAGTVTVTNDNTIETHGNVADGIFAQSVGGGGGAGGNGILGSEQLSPLPAEFLLVPVDQVSFYKNFNMAVGGNSGSSGNGARVDAINNSDITTHGANSVGIFAQSVGGGGGVGGKAAIGLTGTLGIGGKGGAAGNGNTVVVNQNSGTIETFGVASTGIMAQSVGGGGGVAGNVDRMFAAPVKVSGTAITPDWNVGIGVALGQGGGGGGDGGRVIANVFGEIITHGHSAIGVLAHSIGGGGGIIGELGNNGLPLSWGMGSNGDSGNAGPVFVNANANISTAGNFATGIFAQSAAGVGLGQSVNVNVNNAAIRTGEVLDPTLGGRDLDLAGNAIRGIGSVGIMAQSVANASNNASNGNISINIQGAGSVVSGGRRGLNNLGEELLGVGIAVIDGNQNTITNHGLVTTQNGVNKGFAILARGSNQSIDSDFNPAFAPQQGGNEIVSNYGTITGSVDLGAGLDSFSNEAGGTVNSGAFFSLGAGEVFTNSGTLSPGGIDNVFTTTIDGDLVQTVAGVINLDVMGTGSSEIDKLFVTGSFGLGGGSVVFNLMNNLPPVQFENNFTVFDFFWGGTPNAPTLLSDSTLFDDLAFLGMDSTGTFNLLLASDGSFSVSAIPLPAAVWLFGSGLLGLIGISLRKKAA